MNPFQLMNSNGVKETGINKFFFALDSEDSIIETRPRIYFLFSFNRFFDMI